LLGTPFTVSRPGEFDLTQRRNELVPVASPSLLFIGRPYWLRPLTVEVEIIEVVENDYLAVLAVLIFRLES
jgi:hypothetical protein